LSSTSWIAVREFATDVASVSDLASDGAAYITGTTLPVDGGYTQPESTTSANRGASPTQPAAGGPTLIACKRERARRLYTIAPADWRNWRRPIRACCDQSDDVRRASALG